MVPCACGPPREPRTDLGPKPGAARSFLSVVRAWATSESPVSSPGPRDRIIKNGISKGGTTIVKPTRRDTPGHGGEDVSTSWKSRRHRTRRADDRVSVRTRDDGRAARGGHRPVRDVDLVRPETRP